jgi:hypothetical protein
MAFTTISWITCFESFFTVVAYTAALASIHISHFNAFTFLHLVNLCMAVHAFKTLICVCFTVKYDFAGRYSCILDGFSRGNSKSISYKCHCNKET